jgi:preprotein translocase subunit SecG
MIILFFSLIVLASLILGFFVLVQNPKGGGLSGSIAGFNNQFMGVKQTTDVLEKGTWLFAAIIGVLCLVSSLFIKDSSSVNNSLLQKVNTNVPAQTAPATPAPATPAPAPAPAP